MNPSAEPPPARKGGLRSPRRIIALATVLGVTMIVGASVQRVRRSHRPAITGLHLGMSPRQVRTRFEPGARGAMSQTEDGHLEWRPISKVPGRLSYARFEICEGSLCGLTLHWPEGTELERARRSLDLLQRLEAGEPRELGGQAVELRDTPQGPRLFVRKME
jgi:hypothetical protein